MSWSWKRRAIPLLPLWAVRPVQSLSACTVELYLYPPYRPYGLYRASVPLHGCTLPYLVIRIFPCMHAAVKNACQRWWWLSLKFNTGSAPICSEPFLTLTTVHVTNVARILGSDTQGCPTDSSLHTLLLAVCSPRLDHLAYVKENVDDRNAEGGGGVSPSLRVPVAQGRPSAIRPLRFDSDFAKFTFVSKHIYFTNL
jgi:hypothetical protein